MDGWREFCLCRFRELLILNPPTILVLNDWQPTHFHYLKWDHMLEWVTGRAVCIRAPWICCLSVIFEDAWETNPPLLLSRHSPFQHDLEVYKRHVTDRQGCQKDGLLNISRIVSYLPPSLQRPRHGIQHFLRHPGRTNGSLLCVCANSELQPHIRQKNICK